MSKKLLALVFFISSNASFAQTYVESDKDKPYKKIAVLADASTFLLRGIGIKVTYALDPKLSVGAFAGKYELNDSRNDVIEFFDPRHEVVSYGLVGTYFFNSVSESGFYAYLSLADHKVKTTVKGTLANGAEASDTQAGLQAKLGYQFASQILNKYDLLFQVDLGYGTGGAVETSKKSSSQEIDTELQSSLLLGLTAGTHF
jgi:hypothetical protein